MEGVNFVELAGYLKDVQLRETRNNNFHFQGKVAVPFVYKDRETGEEKEAMKYVKVSAWGDIATDLGALAENTSLRVQGTFNERPYDGKCKSCAAPEKKYWTDVLVNNFVVVGA